MTAFKFTVDARGEAFCRAIADEMVRLFGILLEEAVGRINRHWAGQVIAGEHDLVYHEGSEYWAKTIYYGPHAMWWVRGAKLKPPPYP
ncbi:MAG: hypothetical protein HY906_28310 [Deltaproteobacteria bacterium]|nr:hypothetical protein [Deltaproteobacteria bacterium]